MAFLKLAVQITYFAAPEFAWRGSEPYLEPPRRKNSTVVCEKFATLKNVESTQLQKFSRRFFQTVNQYGDRQSPASPGAGVFAASLAYIREPNVSV